MRRSREVALVSLFAAALFVPWLGARDLWNPNEPTYGRAVVEMVERGDLLVPTVNDRVFDEKPILYFWLALAASSLVRGVDEWSLRLPSALAGVALVAMLHMLVAPYAGRRTARIAAAVGGTLYVVWWSARSIQMDLLLTSCTLAVIVCACRVLDHGARPVRWGIAAGAAAGLGFLAKGPVGLICPLLALGPFVLTGVRDPRAAIRSALPAAGAFLVVAAPWYAMLAARGESAFLVELLYRQNVTRFLDPWDHQAPWWYYGLYLWLDALPWSLFLPMALGLRASDDGDGERRLGRLAWGWLAATVLFFSLSASKRSPYIMPALPALAVLVALVGRQWLGGTLARGRAMAVRLIHVFWGLVWVAAAIVLWWRAPELHRGVDAAERALPWIVGVLALAGMAVLVTAFTRPCWASVSLLTGVLLLYLTASATVLPAADAFKSHRGFCAAIREHVGDEPLMGYGLWDWRASYSYYSDRSIGNIADRETLEAYWRRPQRCWLIVERGVLADVRRVIGETTPVVSATVGNNEIHLFGNRQGDDRQNR